MIFLHGTPLLSTLTRHRVRAITRTVLLLAGLVGTAVHGQAETTGRDLNFNLDWRFIREDVPAAEPRFDDAKWTPVSCPHTWNDVDTFDNFSPGGHTGEMDMWTGAAWYRKTFTLPAEARGKRVYVEFEGVRQVAEVYLNGHLLGRNETGFIPFGFDLTPHLKSDAPNVIAVRADSRFDPHFEGDRPWHHPNWHPPHGGIYRNVRLHIVDPLHVTLPLYSNLGTEGIYAWTESLTADLAVVGIDAEVENFTDAAQDADILFELQDARGNVAAKAEQRARIERGARTKITARLNLPNPHLWEPRYPHVYRFNVRIKTNGQVRDVATVPYAPRAFRWDARTGFWINGRNVKLHGWGHKPTGSWAGLGAAVPDWLRDFTFRQMWEAGGNFIRYGHSAGSAFEAKLADQYGFVTLMPGVDGERDCTGKAWATRSAAFRDMLIYFRNHPSILIWEGGNYNISTEHTAELRRLVDRWDPRGQRSFGFRMATPPMLPYIDIEIGTVGRRRAFPNLPVVESEYDRIEAPRRLWDKYSPPDFGRMGLNEERNTYKADSESFAVNAVVEWWTKFASKPDHSGGANWIFHDEPHGSRQVTDAARATGEVDGVRLPKEAWFTLRTLWREAPGVHLIGHWNYPAGTTKTMYAAANGADAAELFVNGRSLGLGQREHHYLYSWKDVTFQAGEIRVVARKAGKQVAEQTKVTAGAPVAVKLTAITAPGGWRADGQDVALFDVEIVDAKGRRCPTAQLRVDFQLTGAGIWRGGYNSGREGSINHLYLDTECGINRVSVRSTREPGEIRLVATSSGLKSAEISVASRAFTTAHGLTALSPARYDFALGERPAIDAAALADLQKRRAVPAAVHTDNAPQSNLFSSYAYTGQGIGDEESALEAATLAYTDNALNYLDQVPAVLEGARILRTALKDTAYWANDYIVATAGRDLTVFVAHDERVPLPGWLKEYQRRDERVIVNEQPLRLYSLNLRKDDVLRIPGNADQGQGSAKTLNLILFARQR